MISVFFGVQIFACLRAVLRDHVVTSVFYSNFCFFVGYYKGNPEKLGPGPGALCS